MATISIELRSRMNKNGQGSLRFILQSKGKRAYIATSVKLEPKYWDAEKQLVKGSHPQAALYNNVLQLKRAEYEAKLATEALVYNEVSLEKVAGRKIRKTSFRLFALDCLCSWENKKADNSLRAYRSMLRKVIAFDAEVALEDISPDWLLRYEHHSRSKCGTKEGGTLKRMSFVSTIIKEALRQQKISADPFLIYKKPAKVNPETVWLTMDEVAAIESYLVETGSDTLKVTGYWFLLSCYSGLRYSDVERFDIGKRVVDDRLILYTQKTGEVVSVKVHTRLAKVLKKLEEMPPVFTNQKSNAYLKAIANFAKISKRLTFHTGRHTFAVNCANFGISQEVTSKLLGHSDLKTTAIYYKIINQRVDAEMDKWG